MEFMDREDMEEDNVWIAVSNGDLPRLQAMLASGVSANAQDDHGYSPLHAAASYGHAEIIEFLVRHAGAIIDIRDEEGDTPLLFCEKPEIYELLVSLGADAGARNTEGQGIVEKAVEDENEELVEYLINKGIINDADFIQKLRAAFESAGMEEFNGQFSMEEGDEGEEDEDDEEDSENHAA